MTKPKKKGIKVTGDFDGEKEKEAPSQRTSMMLKLAGFDGKQLKEASSQRTAMMLKLAEEIAGRGGHVDGNGNLVTSLGSAGPQKLTGFDGKQLKATTPSAVQQAANDYFDRKSDVELAKDKMVFALGRIEAEMKAAGITVAVVRAVGGESMTCRINTSSKLVIKRIK